jgi:hypothetical protein
LVEVEVDTCLSDWVGWDAIDDIDLSNTHMLTAEVVVELDEFTLVLDTDCEKGHCCILLYVIYFYLDLVFKIMSYGLVRRGNWTDGMRVVEPCELCVGSLWSSALWVYLGYEVVQRLLRINTSTHYLLIAHGWTEL